MGLFDLRWESIAKPLVGIGAAFIALGLPINAWCADAQNPAPQSNQHQKLTDAYSTVSKSSFVYDKDEMDAFGKNALTLNGDARIYGLWRVLYSYKSFHNEAKFLEWDDRVRRFAQQNNNSDLDMLARFMKQAYYNEVGSYKSISDDEWKGYMTLSNPALHNIVLLENERKFQYFKQWPQAIEVGKDLLVRLQGETDSALGLLAIAHQNYAYNMLRVGDLEAYAEHMSSLVQLSKDNAFFLQKMDMVFDLAYFAADQNDITLASQLQQIHAKHTREYDLPDLRYWDEELCAFVATKAKKYQEVIQCLKDSAVAKGIVKSPNDFNKLRQLTVAYAKVYDVANTKRYWQILNNLPPSVGKPTELNNDEINAYIMAGEGQPRAAFETLGNLIPKINQSADKRRISAVEDMYQALRKELDKKTAEAKLLNQQVQLRNWLLATAGAVVLLLIAIGVGAALWVVRMRRMQWRLKEAHEHAQAANAAKSRFLAVMSHELRTPLNGVLGMAQALKRDSLSDSQRAKIDTLAESGETLLMLLNDVLDMSRIEAGKVELSPTPASMKDMIERVFNTFVPTIGEKPVALKYDIDATVPQTLSFDMLRVYQCLSNLVSNAVKFTNEGVIRVVASAEKHLDRPGYTVRVEVRDTGIGISKASLGKLFEAYSQADASTARKYGGSGLGLSITQRLTELMGGSVSVTSEEGAGSVFIMTFEAGEVETPAEEAAEITPEDMLPHGVRILLVDDHPVNRKVARLFLEPFGFDITEAVDGQEALDAGMEDYDLVLMDVNMPRLGGIDATRQFRQTEEAGKHVPIIALTADALPEQIEACLAAGMDAHVSKPIVMDKLIDTVVSFLGEDVLQAAQSA